MGINESLVKEFAKQMIKTGARENSSDPKQMFFTLDDATLIFKINANKKPVFFGLIFESVGRDFIVDEEYGVLLQAVEDGSEDPVTFQVNDENLLKYLETYLEWRIAMMRNFNL